MFSYGKWHNSLSIAVFLPENHRFVGGHEGNSSLGRWLPGSFESMEPSSPGTLKSVACTSKKLGLSWWPEGYSLWGEYFRWHLSMPFGNYPSQSQLPGCAGSCKSLRRKGTTPDAPFVLTMLLCLSYSPAQTTFFSEHFLYLTFCDLESTGQPDPGQGLGMTLFINMRMPQVVRTNPISRARFFSRVEY